MPFIKTSSHTNSPTKTVGEIITLKYDFKDQVALENFPLHDVTFLVTVLSSVDDYPQDILLGEPLLDGSVVTQRITQGLIGTIYDVACYIYDDLGGLYYISNKLAILPDSAEGLSILDSLPDERRSWSRIIIPG